ncbi:hypothetical protein D3C75_780060 [compost metagenome]
MIGGLLGFLNVEADGLENLDQERFELEPVHCVHQIHGDEPVGVEMLKLATQTLDENVEVDGFAKAEPGAESRQGNQRSVGRSVRLSIELDTLVRNIVLPEVVVEQSEIGSERRSSLIDP